MFSFNGVLYEFDLEFCSLIKAGKKSAPVEGQLSLFGGDSHWEEEKHARDNSGKFAPKGGGGSGGSSVKAPSQPDTAGTGIMKKHFSHEKHYLYDSDSSSWDEDALRDRQKAHKSGKLASHLKQEFESNFDSDMNDYDADTYALHGHHMLARQAMSKVDWNQVSRFIQNRLANSKHEPPKTGDAATDAVMELVDRHSSDWDEGDDDDIKFMRSTLKPLTNPEKAYRYYRSIANPRSQSYDGEVAKDLGRSQLHTVDWNDVAAHVATQMRLHGS